MAEHPETPTDSTDRRAAESAEDSSPRDRRRLAGDPEAIVEALRRPGPAFGFDLEAGD